MDFSSRLGYKIQMNLENIKDEQMFCMRASVRDAHWDGRIELIPYSALQLMLYLNKAGLSAFFDRTDVAHEIDDIRNPDNFKNVYKSDQIMRELQVVRNANGTGRFFTGKDYQYILDRDLAVRIGMTDVTTFTTLSDAKAYVINLDKTQREVSKKLNLVNYKGDIVNFGGLAVGMNLEDEVLMKMCDALVWCKDEHIIDKLSYKYRVKRH